MSPESIPTWQLILSKAIEDPHVLLRHLGLSAAQVELPETVSGFRMRVPEPYMRKMRHADPQDPLLRQVLPQAGELTRHPDELLDPVADRDAIKRPGLLQKYAGRALLVTTGACGIHCRFCFRRNFPYADSRTDEGRLPAILDYLRDDESIEEVILSGGDPLSLSDDRLARLTGQLDAIPQIKRLRIHTRLPVAVPQRITTRLADILVAGGLLPVVVLHVNHAAEIDDDFEQAVARLHERGVPLLNQSVLLKGVNDSLEALVDLSESLFRAHILPYYLHQLDPVHGSHHFSVPDRQAIRLHQRLQASLPGYLLPRLVREMPGRAAKSPLHAEPNML